MQRRQWKTEKPTRIKSHHVVHYGMLSTEKCLAVPIERISRSWEFREYSPYSEMPIQAISRIAHSKLRVKHAQQQTKRQLFHKSITTWNFPHFIGFFVIFDFVSVVVVVIQFVLC